MTTTDKKKAILRAIESIQEGREGYCCDALKEEYPTLPKQFDDLFHPSWRTERECWTFFSTQGGADEDPFPPCEVRKSTRLTALWFFYHMQ